MELQFIRTLWFAIPNNLSGGGVALWFGCLSLDAKTHSSEAYAGYRIVSIVIWAAGSLDHHVYSHVRFAENSSYPLSFGKRKCLMRRSGFGVEVPMLLDN